MLHDRLRPAFEAVAGGDADPVVRRSQMTDFQADGAMALGPRLGRSPRDVAAEVVAQLDLHDLCSNVEVAGPGFINLTLSDEALGRLTTAVAADDRLGVAYAAKPERIVVDYSAPNVAKEMHVGHLRSTVIGDAAVRILEHLGHEVIRENHIGDWGTPFGMLIEHMLDIGETEAAAELSVGDLNDFYRTARSKFDSDEAFATRSRERVVQLQGGDEATLALWQTLIEQSETYFLTVYDRLGVRLTADDFVGESAYNDQLASVVTDLDEHGLLVDSDGAECVFPPGFTNRTNDPLPLIVRKSDGGYGYASTDLATIRHRATDLKATKLLYVVGLPQSLHLEMVFTVADQMGWLGDTGEARHIGFGSVLGQDRKLLRSRSGETLKLVDLLDEAVRRADQAIAEKNPELDADTRHQVAQQVGMGAIKYADLSSERNKDYVFDYDQMLSFNGNTAPYLQYAHVRIQSIFRKAEIDPSAPLGPISISAPAERALAIELLAFAGVVTEVAESLELHRLTHYLFKLASTFTSFYENCPVLKADRTLRDSRLGLSAATARTLAQGLNLLGIESPDQM